MLDRRVDFILFPHINSPRKPCNYQEGKKMLIDRIIFSFRRPSLPDDDLAEIHAAKFHGTDKFLEERDEIGYGRRSCSGGWDRRGRRRMKKKKDARKK